MQAVGDGTGVSSAYEIHLELKKMPFLGAKAPHYMRHITVGDAATSDPISFQASPPPCRVHPPGAITAGPHVNGFSFERSESCASVTSWR